MGSLPFRSVIVPLQLESSHVVPPCFDKPDYPPRLRHGQAQQGEYARQFGRRRRWIALVHQLARVARHTPTPCRNLAGARIERYNPIPSKD